MSKEVMRYSHAYEDVVTGAQRGPSGEQFVAVWTLRSSRFGCHAVLAGRSEQARLRLAAAFAFELNQHAAQALIFHGQLVT
ncbi:MAG: hypothetical protein WBE26_13320 [Phycisphaerae bacterium]